MEPETETIEQAARRLGLTANALYLRAYRRGVVPVAYGPSGAGLYSREDLDGLAHKLKPGRRPAGEAPCAPTESTTETRPAGGWPPPSG